jgi:hypothetical protein
MHQLTDLPPGVDLNQSKRRGQTAALSAAPISLAIFFGGLVFPLRRGGRPYAVSGGDEALTVCGNRHIDVHHFRLIVEGRQFEVGTVQWP